MPIIPPRHNEQRYSKTSGLPFRPPLPNALLQRTIKAVLPLLFQHTLGGLSVQIDQQSLQRLESIRGERCLLLPNHPAQWDPWAILEMSKRLGENFYYVVAREVFDWHHGIQGWLLQRMGCYSVVRGASDKDSFKTTREILSHNQGRLVVFVEGEISNQNDSLLPLEPGVIQLAFLSLQDLYKQEEKRLDKLPSLFLCPIAIKYFYNPKGLMETIERSIQRLENAMGFEANQKSHYERIRSIGLTVLQEASKQVGYSLSYDDSLNAQIRGLENCMLTKLEEVVNLPFEAELGYLDRVRRIRNTLDRVLKDVSPESLSYYQKRLYEHQKAVLENFYWDLDRIVNFIAIYDGYIAPEMIPERYIEVIRRLEREVFGNYHLQHPRRATLHVLEPIDLKPYFKEFLQDKKKVSEDLIREIEGLLYQAIVTARLPENSP